MITRIFLYCTLKLTNLFSNFQVYKATTKDDKDVAVKVQYIDLKYRFDSDVITIKALLKIIGLMHPDFNFAWIIDDLESTLRQELDFINEGRNSEKCARDLKHLNYIYIPKVYWEYTSSVSSTYNR